MKCLALLLIAALQAIVKTQDLTQLPACGQTCINNLLSIAASQFGCSSGDVNCYCSNPNFGYGVRDCADQSCPSQSDAAAVVAWGAAVCENAVVSSATSELQSVTSVAQSSAQLSSAVVTSEAASSATPEPSTTTPPSLTTPRSTTVSRPKSSTSTSFLTSASSTASTSSTPSPSTSPSTQTNTKSSLSAGAAAGIAVGVTLAVVCAGIGGYIAWRSSKKRVAKPTNGGNMHPGDTDKEVATMVANQPWQSQSPYQEMDGHDARMRQELGGTDVNYAYPMKGELGGQNVNYGYPMNSELEGRERFEMPR